MQTVDLIIELWSFILQKKTLFLLPLSLLFSRESFDSFAWLTNSLRSSGFTSDEVVLESDELISRYRMLVSRTRKSLGASQALLAEEKNLKDYVQSMLSWVHSLKASVLELSSEESKMPLEERLCQLKVQEHTPLFLSGMG